MIDGEQLAVNQLVVAAFESLGIPYYLCGSMASSYHGIYRATADADFVASLRAQHVKPLVGLLRPEFYVDEDAATEAVKTGSSFNLIHEDTLLKVDIFVLKRAPFAVEQMSRRSPMEPGGDLPPMFIATAEDTILSKLDWYRLGGEISDRQWNDILGVLKTQRERLDRDYLQQWARELSVAELLDRALDDAGLA